MAAPAPVREVGAGVSRFRDTCNVYVLRAGREAVLIDFGAGDVLDHLSELGIDRVTDILLTHHHRDQAQGLQRAVDVGARVWVPPVEQDLFARVDEHWRSRQLSNDYDVREDRFSLLEPVAISGTVDEYRTRRFGGFDVYTLPTPGHTVGSVTYLVDVEGRRLAFSGDLVYGQGQVWSLAATQWTYTGVEGQAATVLSCAILDDQRPDVLLPSHGEPIEDPPPALALVRKRLQELVDMRLLEPWDLDAWLRRPWVALTEHLLRNRTSLATTYALLSESGSALLIDFGYDLTTGTPFVSERAARRPLLATLGVLKREFGVERIETVVTTHFHDDHVAGINLLRAVEGTALWSPENVAPILEDPRRYDLPCLWVDPVPVDRVLPFGEPIEWHEYELTIYPLPGHTRYAAALSFEVDGRRVLATGDQQSNDDGRSILNYQYRNRFGVEDYVRSAELYRSLRPDLILGGHWQPLEVADEHLEQLLRDGRRLEQLHSELLPDEGFGPVGFAARIEPYRATVRRSETFDLAVIVHNPLDEATTATVRLVLPDGWRATPVSSDAAVDARGEAKLRFTVAPGTRRERRARVAADLTVGEATFGQQAEALVDVE